MPLSFLHILRQVASGQFVSLPSDQVKRSCAALIGTGRKVTAVVHQPAKAPLSLPENVEGGAALERGKEEGRAIEGLDLAQQVIEEERCVTP